MCTVSREEATIKEPKLDLDNGLGDFVEKLGQVGGKSGYMAFNVFGRIEA